MKRSDIVAEELIAAAITARERAYAPYSNYRVGAAVLTEEGRIVTGCNVENAVYPLTLCAERVAVAKAISEGASAIAAVAVVTANAGSPCGSCRQVIREFAAPDVPVFIARLDGSYHEHTIEALLPESFSVKNLPRESKK